MDNWIIEDRRIDSQAESVTVLVSVTGTDALHPLPPPKTSSSLLIPVPQRLCFFLVESTQWSIV